jgi:hypothetical protein
MTKAAIVMQQIMTELSEAVSEKDKNNGHYKSGTYMNETNWLLELIFH